MEFHRCTMDDLPLINRLIEAWYGKERTYSEPLFRWAFFDRPPEPGLLMSTKDKGRIIGTQAVLPGGLRKGDRVFAGAKSEETLFDSDYRGKGVFKTLYNEVFNQVDPSVDAIWGMTSAKIALIKCGFDVLTRLGYGFIFTGPPEKEFPIGESTHGFKQRLKRSLLSVFHRVSFLKTRFVNTKAMPDSVSAKLDVGFYSAAAKRMARQFPEMVSIDRNEAWMTWRIETNPAIRYQMLTYENGETIGGLVFSENEKKNCVYLIDLVAAGRIDEATDALIGGLVNVAVERGRSCIVDQFLQVDLEVQNARLRTIRKFGSLIKWMPENYFILRTPQRLGDSKAAIDAKYWYYTFLMGHGTRV